MKITPPPFSLTKMEDNSSNLMTHHRRGTESCSSFSRLSLETPASFEELVQKPHRLSDSAFSTIRRDQALTFRDFRLLHRIGAGDIGKVYLCKLRSDDCKSDQSCSYAMKVVDKEVVAAKKKIHRAEMEIKILKMLDHPFLPSLYAHFEASHFSCIVMEYCSGGDLHSLRHKQPQKRFSLSSARFYAAEVLVALEYLHMLGIIYRDLKPENVLVRSDGHIMLSDFDLSLIADSIAAVEFPETSPSTPPPRTQPPPPQFSCLPIRHPFRSRKVQTITSNQMFVAEPVGARSCSFVGTHEYVAPEVASGKSHGNAVDWWAFGVFLYELIYGTTPFRGQNNIATLRNIVVKSLKFPMGGFGPGEAEARDLISGLLEKDPTKRLGSNKGAAEVKTHPFFRGMNFALIRSSTPPPSSDKQRVATPFKSRKSPTNATAFSCF